MKNGGAYSFGYDDGLIHKRYFGEAHDRLGLEHPIYTRDEVVINVQYVEELEMESVDSFELIEEHNKQCVDTVMQQIGSNPGDAFIDHMYDTEAGAFVGECINMIAHECYFHCCYFMEHPEMVLPYIMSPFANM